MTDLDAATPLVMVQQIHRGTADGTRRLILPQQNRALRLAQSKLDRDCFVALTYAQTDAEPPAACQRVIRPGLYYLIYQAVDLDDATRRGATYRYCAPCAVREWAAFAVRELVAE